MLISAARRAFELTRTALVLVLVFVLVAALNGALSVALRGAGLGVGPALLISGAVVFAAVVGGWAGYRTARASESLRDMRNRERLGLPSGPYCLAWREHERDPDWRALQPVRVRYPRLARRYGLEGLAIVAFEIGEDGRVGSIRTIECWPAPMFRDAVVAALKQARFAPGKRSYQMPFVFRLRGGERVGGV
jgi:TonB family protein